MHRGPHGVCADEIPALQGLARRSGIERGQPTPQTDIDALRRLGLKPDEMLDRIQRGQLGALQQQLPGQGGSVQPATVEAIGHDDRCRVAGPV